MIDNIKKIAISGGNGKMGKLLSEHIKGKDSFEVSGIYDPISKSKEYKNFKDYKEVKADFLFEFSPFCTKTWLRTVTWCKIKIW